jgi:hypothetical protein
MNFRYVDTYQRTISDKFILDRVSKYTRISFLEKGINNFYMN